VDIPLKIRLSQQLHALHGFRIVRFQDNYLTDPDLHWYVLIRVPQEAHFLVIIITSEINKRISFYRNTRKPRATECLVKIDNDVFSFLTKPSIIECNQTKYLNIEEIVHRVDEAKGFTIRKEQVPDYLRKVIVSAILRSPLMSRFKGDKAKAANPL